MGLKHEISIAGDADRQRLFEVWESSVRATHRFLGEEGVRSLVPAVRAELATLSPVHCLRDEGGRVCAFMFVAERKIEALFVAAEHRGAGAGRTLIEFALRSLGASEVDVNEQNEDAAGFYRRFGFRAVRRSPTDGEGRPYPLLHMSLASCIRLARGGEAPQLRRIEDEAGRMFEGLGLVDPARDASFPPERLAQLVDLGQVWVATHDDDVPVGMVVVSAGEGAAYIEEIDVLPAHGRRGIGGMLLGTACRWARERGLSAATLSTFRDVPWNGPFYRKHGFRDLTPAEWTPEMHAIRQQEALHGLRVEARVFMRRDLRS